METQSTRVGKSIRFGVVRRFYIITRCEHLTLVLLCLKAYQSIYSRSGTMQPESFFCDDNHETNPHGKRFDLHGSTALRVIWPRNQVGPESGSPVRAACPRCLLKRIGRVFGTK